MSTAAYQRAWRAKHRSNRPPGRPVTAPCGTRSAYKRHLYNGEEPCQACREEWNAYQRRYYAARKGTT
jgi:hypothetical protein